MKKLSLIIALLLCFTLVFSACTAGNVSETPGNETGEEASGNPDDNGVEQPENGETDVIPNEPVIVKAASLKGPTSMGLVKVIDDSMSVTDSDYIFDFTIEAAADAISPKLIKGELDIAAVPANLASVIYNKTEGGVVVLNINTLGVLYIVENGNTVNTVEDLRGKTIYASGKGNTPEYALNYMLSSNGLVPGTDVFVEFKSEHAECVAAISAEANAVAMLPQPFATTAMMSNSSIRIALDINKEWETASGKTLVTGVTVARKAFVEEHPEAVAEFLAQHKASAEYVNANVDEAAGLIEKFDIVKAAVAKSAIPYCQISCITGEDMKTELSDYLTVLAGQNAASIGGTLPGDDFYYVS